MHLKSLTLKGFKSFASATTLKFEPGICAVVGPNGSGKSNVVDALAWVMGEQGAKTLRGGKMQDVIFAGAGERKPLGRAEVTLTIDNSDGRLPIEYSEVSVTRRMFRDGASEYEINGAKARLMDIQELLSDSGIGREMHIIVGQGKLSEILESRPEERRAYIEEAAGVLKHRRRKEKAQRKLAGMQGNLDRLRDLTEELGRQLKPLARQAEAARRAATVQATVRDARLRLAGDRIVTLRLELSDASRQADVYRDKVVSLTEDLEERTEEQVGWEERLADIVPQEESAQHLWFRLSTLTERVNATARIAAERARTAGHEAPYSGMDPDLLERRAREADEEFARLEEAAEMARERLEAIEEEAAAREEAAREAEREHLAQIKALADHREGVVRLLAAEENHAARVSSAQEELERHRAAVEEAQGRLGQVREEWEAARDRHEQAGQQRVPLAQASDRAAAEARSAEERLEQVRATQREHEREVYTLSSRIETLRHTAPRASAAEILEGEPWGRLSREIRPRPGVELALAAALGHYGEALVGPVGEEVVDTIRQAGAERTVLVTRQSGDTDGVERPWRMDADLAAGTEWLLDHVELSPAVAAAVNRLVADVVLAPDWATAQAAVAADPRVRAVTRQGEIAGQGWVQLGRDAASSVAVEGQISRAQDELTAARTRLGELSGTVEGATLAAQEARVEAASATATLREHDAQAQGWARETQRLERTLAEQTTARDTARARVGEAEQRLAQTRAELAAVRQRLSLVDTEDVAAEEPSTEARDSAKEALAQVRAMEIEAKLSARSAEERVEQARGKAQQLRRQASHERAARARHEQAMAARRAEAALARAVAEGAQEVARRVEAAVGRAVARRDAVKREKAQIAARVSGAKDAVSAVRQQLGRLSDTAHAAEIAVGQAQVRLDEAEAKAAEQLGMAVADLVAEYAPGPDFDRREQQARLKQAEKDLSALGKVNPLALEEYKALEERYQFLSTQLADVEAAREDLEGVIEEVDERILRLFMEAWRDVEEEFPKVFHTLFPGGQGRLVLTEPEDMLTTGIELEARPPGKKVKRLSLLSGGEKSLTALALLVAIFRARPSPFYVMDEVEAALDDVNLRRLINLFKELRRDSQLIVITHQKPTMDVANVLYGVTMRGDGITRVLSQRMQPDDTATEAATLG
ncbi:chromosome segregation protein SMC [Corynebacterium sp. zg-331]|uniref:chromosome segregation protein SMC n=1 Tax=unclassified Corynebacterium TaxID=2624378 RepID=UPI00128B36AA|nr:MULTISPECIES: chromosome segregation protein SMC [unclassified Corynebacterium]MBC3185291.1 chromosome segregation protein SMC [Corynebacterium sp. zg-331]MPV51788.1 chromosome segregation protein SMC [Corynebacterium sp. zg331]